MGPCPPKPSTVFLARMAHSPAGSLGGIPGGAKAGRLALDRDAAVLGARIALKSSGAWPYAHS